MLGWHALIEWKRLWRYYQAGVVNTAFGFGLYALFVWLGLGIYAAQLLSHALGVLFNYFTYSRYAFSDSQTSKWRFFLSYVGNYFLGLLCLAIAARFISNPYASGLTAAVIVSLANYFVLKKLVFRQRVAS